MRFTAVQSIINDKRGLDIWISRKKYSAYYLVIMMVIFGTLEYK